MAEDYLDLAIENIGNAVEATTTESPEPAMIMIQLGDHFSTRHTLRGDLKDLKEAARYYAIATKFETAPIRIRLIAADRRLSAVKILHDLERHVASLRLQ